MANKKAGNRAAASQARARERAKRKARSSGPSISEAALAKPAPVDDAVLEAPNIDAAETAASAADSSPPAVASSSRSALPQPERRRPTPAAAFGQRKTSPQAPGLAPAGGLRRELALIGVITAIIGGTLAYLKLATDLGS